LKWLIFFKYEKINIDHFIKTNGRIQIPNNGINTLTNKFKTRRFKVNFKLVLLELDQRIQPRINQLIGLTIFGSRVCVTCATLHIIKQLIVVIFSWKTTIIYSKVLY